MRLTLTLLHNHKVCFVIDNQRTELIRGRGII